MCFKRRTRVCMDRSNCSPTALTLLAAEQIPPTETNQNITKQYRELSLMVHVRNPPCTHCPPSDLYLTAPVFPSRL
jgi:hypothetical protein